MDKRAVITIVNSLSPTSMDFHDFVLYRAKHFGGEENHFLILGPVDKGIMRECELLTAPFNINLIDCDGSYSKLCRILNDIKNKLRSRAIATLMHVHMGRSGTAAILSNLLKPSKKIPVLYTVHNTRKLATWKSELLLPVNMLGADEVVVVSRTAFESIPRYLRLLKKKHIRVIINGADTKWIEQVVSNYPPKQDTTVAGKECTDSKNYFILLSVCRLCEAKNLPWLVKLVKKMPDRVKLRFVGEGPLRSELELLVRKFGLEHFIEFVGLLHREKVFEEMLRADLFVSSSHWEGLPIAVIEAMAAEMPVILSDIGPHREIANHGSSVCVLPLDMDRWVKRVQEFVDMDKGERVRIGSQNSDIVKKHFSLERMHKEYSELYEKLWNLSERFLK